MSDSSLLSIPEWHATNVNNYKKCPRSCVADLKSDAVGPPTWEMFRGTAFHSVMEHFMMRPPAMRTRLVMEDIIDEAPWWESVDYQYFEHMNDELRAACEVYKERYFELEDPTKIEVVGTELNMRLMIHNVPYVGTIDRIDIEPAANRTSRNKRIVDYKTGSYKDKDEWRQDARRQIVIYALAYYYLTGELPYTGQIIWLGDTYRVEDVDITVKKIDQAKMQLLETYVGATAQINPPITSPLCGWCNHVPDCEEGIKVVQARLLNGQSLSSGVQGWMEEYMRGAV